MNPVDVATSVIELVGDAAEAEVTVDSTDLALTRFANSFIHQNVADASSSARLRVALDGRVAVGSTARLDREGLRRLVEETMEVAKLSPVDEAWPGVAPAEQITTRTTSRMELPAPSERASHVDAFVAAGPEFDAAGYCDTQTTTLAYANTNGHAVSGVSTRATIDGIHRTGKVAGSGHATAQHLDQLDGGVVGLQAADRARQGADPIDIAPGEYEVVLAPECIATIAIFLGYYGFNGKQVADGQSFVDVGAQQFDPAFHLWDDPMALDGLGFGFDTEGTSQRRVDLINGGVTMGTVHDRRTALRLGTDSTGHAGIGSETYGPTPLAMVIGDGNASHDELVSQVERGLFVATFNYCRILDPKTMVVTGLTRNGTFLIEDGEITKPVTNLRFTQSFVDGVGPGRVLGVGSDRRFADSEFGAGYVQAPSMRLAGWKFTGGAEG